jgi:hypothetical protein
MTQEQVEQCTCNKGKSWCPIHGEGAVLTMTAEELRRAIANGHRRISEREQANGRWREAYASQTRSAPEMTVERRALAVITLDATISTWLAEHDPQALKQAQRALNGTSWEDYLAQ